MSTFNTEGMKQRKTAAPVQSNGQSKQHTEAKMPVKQERDHPAGPIKHGGPMQAIRILVFGLFFVTSCLL